MRAWLIRLALAIGLLLGTASQAYADPISAAVLTYIGIQATAAAVAVTTFALTFVASTALSIGASYIQKALSKKPEAQQNVGGVSGQLRAGGAVPRSFIIGEWATAGSLVYANTYGSAGNTPNAYLFYVISLADLPITSMTGLFVNGAAATWDAETAPGATVAIPEFNKDGADYLWVRFYDGTQTAPDAELVAKFGSHATRPYEASRIGTGIAYAVCIARVNADLFSGFPEFRFVLQGTKFYDRRFDDTAGGSGPQRKSDPATWAWTDNNAVAIERILEGIRYDSKWLYGGQTVGAAQLPAASFVAAANECDAPIDLAGGGTEKQFRCGAELQLNIEPAAAIEELLKGCNGRLAEIGGTYKLRVGAAGAAVFSFTDADIITSEPQTFDPFTPSGQAVNHVTARYISPAEGWNEKDAPALADTTLEAADGGRRQSVAVGYGFVSSGTQVQRLMKSERDDNRAWRRHVLPMPPEAFALEPLDVVSWTSARNGYADKTFSIETGDDLPNFHMGLALKELDPNAYDWSAETDERPITEGTIVIERPPPQPIIDWFAEAYILQAGGIARAAIQLGWDPGTDDVDGVRFEVRVAATEEVVLRGSAELHGFLAGSIIVSQGLLPATEYEARGQYRPASARPVTWSDWLSVTTNDVRINRDELSNDLDARLRQLEERIPHNDDVIRKQLEALAGAVNTQVTTILERIGRVNIGAGARYLENKAGVEQALTAAADANGALAAFKLSLFAESGGQSAQGFLRFVVAAAPSGVIASFAIEINVGTLGTPDWKKAGIYLDVFSG